MISEHDLGGERGPVLGHGWKVDDLSSSRVVVAAPEMSVSRAAALLREHRIGCLPVVDGKQLRRGRATPASSSSTATTTSSQSCTERSS